MTSLADVLGGPQPRFSLTLEEWMADAIADPKAYGLTDSEVEYYKAELAKTEPEKKA
jgi:hypothetical protein